MTEQEKQQRQEALRARFAQKPRAVLVEAIADPRTDEEKARAVSNYIKELMAQP